MSLNTDLGWSLGDDVRVLVAAGISVGIYQIQQIQRDMNYIGTAIPSIISPVKDLLDEYDAIQTTYKELNTNSEGKILKKVDVLEWEPLMPGGGYGPERELMRIRGLLYQYFASSILFEASNNGTPLVRS
jgi:hypothetical protein